jgi:hypothetical protein
MDLLDNFINKKKAESIFVSLEDGESIKVLNLREIKSVQKAGFGGEEKTVLRLVVDVETSEGIKTKHFDNGTQRFATELRDKGVNIGSSFVITRNGQQTKTRYTISGMSDSPAGATPAGQIAGQENLPAELQPVTAGGDDELPFSS